MAAKRLKKEKNAGLPHEGNSCLTVQESIRREAVLFACFAVLRMEALKAGYLKRHKSRGGEWQRQEETAGNERQEETAGRKRNR